MPFCPNCDADVAKDALNCTQCGATFGPGSAWQPRPTKSSVASQDVLYPRLIRRVQAVLIDWVLLITIFYTWLATLSVFGESHLLVKIFALVLPVMIIGPGLVTFTGGTLGHHIKGLRIRDSECDENIGLFRATVRALLRTFLGWLSFVFILLTKKHQALHDYVTSTIVVLRRPETLPAHEKLGVRTSDEHEILSFPKRDDVEYLYPSKVRRILAILLYGLLITIALCVFALVLISEECSLEDRCSPVENLTMEVVGLGWLISIGTTIVLGWRGLLFCCHRKALPPSAAADS